jgi:hypothetical protein
MSVSENRTPDKLDHGEVVPSESLSISEQCNNEEESENVVVPFLAIETTKRKRSGVWSDLEVAPKSVKPVMQSTQQVYFTQQQPKQSVKPHKRKRTFLSPNTAAYAIASTLSSPFNPSSPNKSPSKRSMAEATLYAHRRGSHSPRCRGVSVLDSTGESPLKMRGVHSPLRRKSAESNSQSEEKSNSVATEKTAQKPVRAMSAYTLFCIENRERVKRKNPSKTQAAIVSSHPLQ